MTDRQKPIVRPATTQPQPAGRSHFPAQGQPEQQATQQQERPTFNCSVIICAYTEKRWPDLLKAVESLRQQTVAPAEVILVVDHNPRLMQLVQREMPDVVAVENLEENGLSGARNSGLAAATSEVIAFLDDDAVAAPNWLDQLMQEYTDPQVVGVGGASLPIWVHHQPAWFPEEFNWVVGCSYRGLPPSTATVRNLIGCNMSFRREVFDTVGGFRNGIGRVNTRPVGCEETELCIRANQRWPDRIMVYKPDARVFHHVPGSRASWRYFFARCYFEGIAKAFVSRYIGQKDGLASEWTYSLRTLPNGVIRGLSHTAVNFDPNGLARALAIVAGLGVTATGYLVGKVARAT